MHRPLQALPFSLLVLSFALVSIAVADTNYQPLPFSQNWSNTGLIVATDSWAGVPGVLGLGGMGMGANAGVDPQTLLTSDGTSGRVVPNLTDPLGAVIEGVAEFHLSDPVIALAGSSNMQSRAPHLVLHLNATGSHSIVVSYRLRDLEGAGGTDNAVQRVALQFRVGGSGLWTNVPAGYVADATDGPGLTKETLVSATLPPAANFASQLQVRIITANAAGNDEWVGVDDISVTGTQSQFENAAPPILAGGGAYRGASWGHPLGTSVSTEPPVLFVTSEGTAHRVFRYNPNNVTWSADSNATLGLSGRGGSGAWVSLGEDRFDRLCVPTSTGLQFVRMSKASPGADPDYVASASITPARVMCQAWADFDLDGNADLFVADTAGACALYRSDFYGALTLVTAPGFPLSGLVNGAEWGDFDGDGDPDLLLGRQDRSSVVVRNLGGGVFDTLGFGAVSTDRAYAAAWVDFDEDGDLDAFFTRDGASCRLLRNNAGAWSDVTPTALATVSAWRGAGWADYDRDGDLDLYIVRLGGGDVFLRNDSGSWTDITATESVMLSESNGIAVAWGDYEQNGTLALYVTRQGAPASLFRHALPEANNHFRVVPLGRHQNRMCTGMNVRIVVGGVSHSRTISGGSGYLSQSEPFADFGVGTANSVDSVIVRWPDGSVIAAAPSPGVNRTVTATQPSNYFIATPPLVAAATFGASWRFRDADTSELPNLVLDGRHFTYSGITIGLTEEVHYNHYLPKGSYLWGQVSEQDGPRWGLLLSPIFGSPAWSPRFWEVYSELGNAPYLADSSTAPWFATGALPNTGASWVDVDGDGDLDAHVLTGATGGVVFRQDPGSWTEATPPMLAAADSAYHAAWADIDGDRDPDVLIVGSGKRHQLLRNDGANWTDVTPPVLSAAPVAEFGWDASFADYDDDGDLDLLIFDSNGAHLYRRDGASWSVANIPALSALGSSYVGATWSDFDLDGDLDLFVGTETMGGGHTLFNTGAGDFVDDTRVPFVRPQESSAPPAVADVDRDGDPDLVVPGLLTTRVYVNSTRSNAPGSGSNWFHLGLVGVESNRDGIGARIELVAGGRKQTRIVTGDLDYLSQSAYPVIFGLGSATVIDSIRISWPSGVTFDTTGVAVRQSVTWLERQRLLVADVSPAEGAALALTLGSANPFVNRLALGFTLPTTTDVRLTVHDIQGRLVQTLATGVRTAGQHRVSWNTRGADGSTASPGVYWVRLAARDANGEQVRTRKVVLSR